MKKDSGFYQMKCQNDFIPRQTDNCNCSIGVILAIMRFSSAFKKNTVSKHWICDDEDRLRCIIPSSIFESTSYSTTERSYLKDVRNEIFNLLDAMAFDMQRQYEYISVEILYKAQLASGAYKEEQRRNHSSKISLKNFKF